VCRWLYICNRVRVSRRPVLHCRLGVLHQLPCRHVWLHVSLADLSVFRLMCSWLRVCRWVCFGNTGDLPCRDVQWLRRCCMQQLQCRVLRQCLWVGNSGLLWSVRRWSLREHKWADPVVVHGAMCCRVFLSPRINVVNAYSMCYWSVHHGVNEQLYEL